MVLDICMATLVQWTRVNKIEWHFEDKLMICWSKHRQAQIQRTNSRQLINKSKCRILVFWLTWRPNTKIPNRSDRGAAAVTCDLEEILPSAKISRSVNQVCRDHPTGEDYPMISAQPIIELCKKHGIRIASYAGATPLLVYRWSTEERSAHYSSSTRTDAPHSHYWRSDSIKVDIAEGSNSDNVGHLHIWLMPDGWHSK